MKNLNSKDESKGCYYGSQNKDKHPKMFLIPQSRKYATSHGKRDFVGMIKLTFLRHVDEPSLSLWAQCNHKDLMKRELRGSNSEKVDLTMKVEIWSDGL